MSVTVSYGSSKKVNTGKQAVTITPLPSGCYPPFVGFTTPTNTMSRPLSTAAQSILAGSCYSPSTAKNNRQGAGEAVRKGKQEAKTFTIRNVNPPCVFKAI